MFEQPVQQSAIGHARAHVFRRQSETSHDIDGDRQQLRVCHYIRFTNDIDVQLKMFTQATLLRPLVAKQLWDREPTHRLSERLRTRANHARERRRHFGAHGNRTVTLVDEVVQLRDDFVATLLCVQIEWFEWRPIVLLKCIAPHDAAPGFEDVGSLCKLLRVEVSKSR